MERIAVIDNGLLKLVAVVPTVEQAEYHAQLKVKGGRDFLITGVMPEDLTGYTHTELRALFENILANGRAAPAGADIAKMRYEVSQLLRCAQVDETPLEELQRQHPKPLPQPVPPKAEPEPAQPRAKRQPSTGPVSRPKSGATARVWELCDSLSGDRDKVIAAGLSEGLNPSTIKVQYSKWKKSQ